MYALAVVYMFVMYRGNGVFVCMYCVRLARVRAFAQNKRMPPAYSHVRMRACARGVRVAYACAFQFACLLVLCHV